MQDGNGLFIWAICYQLPSTHKHLSFYMTTIYYMKYGFKEIKAAVYYTLLYRMNDVIAMISKLQGLRIMLKNTPGKYIVRYTMQIKTFTQGARRSKRELSLFYRFTRCLQDSATYQIFL